MKDEVRVVKVGDLNGKLIKTLNIRIFLEETDTHIAESTPLAHFSRQHAARCADYLILFFYKLIPKNKQDRKMKYI